jgi:hypothetical protein
MNYSTRSKIQTIGLFVRSIGYKRPTQYCVKLQTDKKCCVKLQTDKKYCVKLRRNKNHEMQRLVYLMTNKMM